MPKIKEIKEAQDSVLRIEQLLIDIISRKAKIRKESIDEFNNLIRKLGVIADIFFEKFEGRHIDQIVTYGAISIATDICVGLKDNLEFGMNIGKNPIEAAKIIDKNYLLFYQIMLEALEKIYNENRISDENFTALNESIKNLVVISKEDRIYPEKVVKFKNKESEESLLRIFRNAAELEI
jgi:hypothetical protein